VTEVCRITETPKERNLSDGLFEKPRVRQIFAAFFEAPRPNMVAQRIARHGEQAMEMAQRHTHGRSDIDRSERWFRDMRVDELKNPATKFRALLKSTALAA